MTATECIAACIAELRALVPADDMRVAGFSATPFRLDCGRLDEGEGKIFDDVVFDYGIGQGIRDGWLSPLTSKATGTEINISGVGRRGGEFIAGELERAADDSATVSAACDEIVARGVDRRSWLVFCCGVAHAHHVGQALRARGVSCRVVTGETPLAERADSIAAFKAGMIRCLVNVNVLTTGFDAPRVDLLAMLRPTLSTGLYVQMVGRGTRKADGKVNCLILDFAGNCRRHGPVDQVDIKVGGSNGAAVAPATVRTKTCPDCAEINPLDAAACCCCGYEWPKPKPAARHATSADAVPILTGERVWLPVTDVSFHRHHKYGDPGRAAVVPGRLSLRPLALCRIRLLRAPRLRAHLRRALVVRAGGIRAGPGDGGRGAAASARARSGGRDRGRA